MWARGQGDASATFSQRMPAACFSRACQSRVSTTWAPAYGPWPPNAESSEQCSAEQFPVSFSSRVLKVRLHEALIQLPICGEPDLSSFSSPGPIPSSDTSCRVANSSGGIQQRRSHLAQQVQFFAVPYGLRPQAWQ